MDNFSDVGGVRATMVPMRPSAPLPAHLATAPFTVHEARSAGLSSGRLRSSDLTTVAPVLVPGLS
ncbi:hypothetical protein [Pseudarthrobacter sp. N5]|uniref:hypothetical protein n=1 Tax=Pseudarthrobacter sp. N5 TaxID=3418416 RepID=UPI003CF45DDF